MNLLDAQVLTINSEPYEMYGKWWVDVTYECWGQEGNSSLMFNTIVEAESIQIGYKFLT